MPNPESLPVSKIKKATVAFVFFTVFLDMLSIGIIIPVLPKLIEGFVGGASNAGYWMGGFGALWGLMQFIFSPIQGGLSDAYGRRPVILGSNFGTGLDYFLMAFAPNIWILLLGRAISGATSASISTAYAYISDLTKPEERAKYFGLMGAAFGVGFVVGPAIGGYFGHINPHFPFIVAGVLSLANACYGLFVLPESLSKDKRKPFTIKSANPLGALKFLAKQPEVLKLSIMNLIAMFAHSVLPTAFVLYAGYRYGWGADMVGYCLAVVGICSAIVQAGLTGMIVKKMGEKNAMLLGLFFGIIGFCGYGLAPTGMWFFVVIPFMSMWGLTTPNIQALMTAKTDVRDQGQLQGANMSLSSVANIFAPLVFGSVFSLSTSAGMDMAFSGAALILAACILGLAFFMGLSVKAHVKHTQI